jgi:stage II sporulation protein D
VFTGRGYGHGIGMSQWGMQGMALAGKNAEQILKHYYQGIELTNTGGA